MSVERPQLVPAAATVHFGKHIFGVEGPLAIVFRNVHDRTEDNTLSLSELARQLHVSEEEARKQIVVANQLIARTPGVSGWIKESEGEKGNFYSERSVRPIVDVYLPEVPDGE
jgi:hypothetical protein